MVTVEILFDVCILFANVLLSILEFTFTRDIDPVASLLAPSSSPFSSPLPLPPPLVSSPSFGFREAAALWK